MSSFIKISGAHILHCWQNLVLRENEKKCQKGKKDRIRRKNRELPTENIGISGKRREKDKKRKRR